MTSYELDVTYEQYITLEAALAGDTPQGTLHAKLRLSAPSDPGYELAVLAIGVFLTTIGLCWGFYVWRASKIQERDELSKFFLE